MKQVLPLLMAGACMSASAGLPDQLRQCRSLVDSAARLKCYDALSIDDQSAAVAGGIPKSPATAPHPASMAVPSTVPTPPADQFGKPVAESTVEFIESRIPGVFEGWEPNSVITLANGQAWRIVDGSRGAYFLRDPKVRIRRGVLGSYILEIEGENKSPKVRRVK